MNIKETVKVNGHVNTPKTVVIKPSEKIGANVESSVSIRATEKSDNAVADVRS